MYRSGPRLRWLSTDSLRDVLAIASPPDGAEVVVVEETDVDTTYSECARQWARVFLGSSLVDFEARQLVVAPGIRSGYEAGLTKFEVGTHAGITVVQISRLGTVGPAAWLDLPGSNAQEVVADFVQSSVSKSSTALCADLAQAVRLRIAELAAAEARELTERALASINLPRARQREPDLVAAEQFLGDLWAVRLRQRNAQALCRGRAAKDEFAATLLQRSVDEVDSLTTLIMTQRLFEHSRSSQELAQVQRQTEAAEREDRAQFEWKARRDERVLAILASMFLAPSLVVGYFGVSNSPTTFLGVDQSSWQGQVGILGVAVLAAALVYWVVRRVMREEQE